LPANPGAARGGGRRSQLRFLRVVCPANHPLIEVVPGLDGPVVLLKDPLGDKTRPATRLADLIALGSDVSVRCSCACANHDVLAAWIAVKLGGSVVRVVWDGFA
jgi:hypothetical protein